MKKDYFQVSIDAKPVRFTQPPVLKEGVWFVPVEHFAKRLGVKVEYPAGENMVVLCGGTDSEICVPLQFQNSADGEAIDIEGVAYARPARIAEPFGFEVFETSANVLEVVRPEHLSPEFTLPDLEGTPRDLAEFRGKKTLLYVWGSW